MSKLDGNSTYIMLSTAIIYISVFYCLAKKEKLCAPFQPTVADWNFARHLCDRLRLFFDITELLSGTTYVTANCSFPKFVVFILLLRSGTLVTTLSY
jgi:hypothetical protein